MAALARRGNNYPGNKEIPAADRAGRTAGGDEFRGNNIKEYQEMGMEIRKLLQILSGPKAVTVAMWGALLVLALIVGLALMNCGSA
jgi:hypothetical protein